MEKRTWILVADASRARLFRGDRGKYAMIEEFEHPESRASVRELVSDANGRKPGGGYGHRPGVAPHTDPKDVEADKFAHLLAIHLEKGLHAQAYEALVLVAPPRFLGELKGQLTDQVQKRLTKSIQKDLTGMTPHEIAKRIARQAA
jgi:protein required for attachment to host cells